MNLEIAVLDDEQDIVSSLLSIIEKEGQQGFGFTKPGAFLESLTTNSYDLLFLDINLGDDQINGLQVLEKLSKQQINTRVVVISGNADLQLAVTALKKGARDFLEKPLHLEQVLRPIKDCRSILQTSKERDTFLDGILEKYRIIGESEVMLNLKQQIRQLANLNEAVLIQGESGTGKELVAGMLHYLSKRRDKKLYKLNIASLPQSLLESQLFGHKKGAFSGAEQDFKGFFQTAQNSSLFLDEIGEFSIDLQPKLLRAIQEKEITPLGSTESRPVDLRLIFATNRDLQQETQKGSFREDLYYRISTFSIQVAPLRQRGRDILLLARHFIQSFSEENNINHKELSSSAEEKLLEYNYPGNARELKNIIVQALFHSKTDIIKANDINLQSSKKTSNLEQYFKQTKTLSEKKQEMERLYIQAQLQKNNGDYKKTAEDLGILVNNLYRKVKNLTV